ncbi:MAG: isocyanide synthase family protein [Proteobacteria bacterium]|nr:isocyanide synthase family protein [Pseudomonadota bacterium]
MTNTLANTVYNIINEYRKNPYNLEFTPTDTIVKLNYFISNKLPIHFVLPAFHGKVNSPACVLSHLPDMGDYIGIQTFSQLCQDVQKVYAHGAILTLVHEGHFYTDTLLVSNDHDMDHYLLNLRTLLRKFDYMRSLSIKEFFPNLSNYTDCRAKFINNFVPTTEEITSLVSTNNKYKQLYTAYKKIYSDYLLPHYFPNNARSFCERNAKKHALTQLSRYVGFSKLEKAFFKDPYIRLSAIYKDPTVTEQISVNYIKDNHTMATPAFYSLMKKGDNSYDFIKSSHAFEAGLQPEYHQGYAFFIKQS